MKSKPLFNLLALLLGCSQTADNRPTDGVYRIGFEAGISIKTTPSTLPQEPPTPGHPLSTSGQPDDAQDTRDNLPHPFPLDTANDPR